MPTILSITMAIGARQLAKKRAIVTRLAAIEELAGVDVLCSDKTGTLTLNQLTTYEPICFNNYSKDEIINYAALVSKSDNPSPINKAILNSLKDKTILNRYQISNIKPFDSKNKRTEITLSINDQVMSVSVGATEAISQLTNNDSTMNLRIASITWRLKATAV